MLTNRFSAQIGALSESAARCTLLKAHVFLGQAEATRPDDRRGFCANLEAAIVFGRSVTFHLQKDYAHREGFKEWYEPHRACMEADSVCRYVKEQRNFVLKQGSLTIRHSISVSHAVSVVVTDSVQTRVVRGQPWYRRHPGMWWEAAREMVMRFVRTDRERRKLGAMGAERQQPLVGQVVEPSQFDHPGLGDRPAVDVVREYLDKLEVVVNQAEAHFGAE